VARQRFGHGAATRISDAYEQDAFGGA